jgi:hypothetical protein
VQRDQLLHLEVLDTSTPARHVTAQGCGCARTHETARLELSCQTGTLFPDYKGRGNVKKRLSLNRTQTLNIAMYIAKLLGMCT